MNKFDVICIGAALVDIIAKVERHPIEDDEVFVSDLHMISGGAAANTATGCSILGLNSAFIGKLGYDDGFGKKIIEDFYKNSVDTHLIKFSKKFKTGSAYIALNSEGDRRIYAHSGAADYLTKEDIIEDDLIASKMIFLSSLRNINPFIKAGEIGKKNKIPVILNPGMLIIDQGYKKIKDLLKNIDILILSEKEYKTLMNITDLNYNQNQFIEENRKLLDLDIKITVITLGKKGALLLSEKQSLLINSMKIDQVIDTTGAGDAFSAGFIYGYLQNLSLEFNNLIYNVKIGHYVAGKCIQELGARNGLPNKSEIEFFMKRLNKKV
ncbi:MAG: carbohydrate kinase family protein [Candidatus Lokiarchaeota archaeon]|nr:carbohydrate kinase family protein [Candidatus Lokiarchaeota archaeon]